ncbi:ArsS family sensor histidine kinase [Arcobacter sp. s6]|uniref:ArsS family sensor histidine kinase n=1 Tax=Arcobacter sp. s6 TaxID=3230363 RepID=UPI0034A063C2
MNFNSLFTKIVFVFIISIVLFLAVFISYYSYQKNLLLKQIRDNYVEVTKYIHENRLSPQEIESYLNKLNFKAEINPQEIIYNSVNVSSGPGFDIIKNEDNFYMIIVTPDFRILFKDSRTYSLEYLGFWILGIVFIIFTLSFLWIIQSLKPLKNLKMQIQNFSKGNLEIDCKSNKKDEIADVANEFDSAVKKIALLLNSRQLFLRTVMHELKTPIAKGRIVSELIDDNKQKDRMINIFDKLNFLINDFSKIEQIVSKNYKINKFPISINKVLEKSIDMMMLEKPQNKIEIENILDSMIKVDLDLFSLAIKNLLDNGIKYSSDKKVKITLNKDEILIISKGDKLHKPIEEYFKPYHNDTSNKNHGMGLGLYIVSEILSIHNMELRYEYLEDMNIFKINL